MAQREDIRLFLAAFFVVILDQAAKAFVMVNIPLNEKIVLIKDVFSISHASNTGVAFGILQGYNIVFIWVYVMLIGLIIYSSSKARPAIKIPVGLVLGAVVSNMLDRIFFNGVTDFIKIGIFPSFNIADASACIGVGLIIFYFWDKKE